MGRLAQSADANKLLLDLRFLVRFALNRLARRGQSPGRLGRRRAQRVDSGEDGLPLAGKRGPLRRLALDLVRGNKRSLTFPIERILGIADPGLDLEQRVRR